MCEASSLGDRFCSFIECPIHLNSFSKGAAKMSLDKVSIWQGQFSLQQTIHILSTIQCNQHDLHLSLYKTTHSLRLHCNYQKM